MGWGQQVRHRGFFLTVSCFHLALHSFPLSLDTGFLRGALRVLLQTRHEAPPPPHPPPRTLQGGVRLANSRSKGALLQVSNLRGQKLAHRGQGCVPWGWEKRGQALHPPAFTKITSNHSPKVPIANSLSPLPPHTLAMSQRVPGFRVPNRCPEQPLVSRWGWGERIKISGDPGPD